MAAGDITYDTDPVTKRGNRSVVSGTLEADTTLRTFAVLGTGSRIMNAQFTCDLPSGGTAVQARINKNADDDATNGSVAVDTGAAATLRFAIDFV